MHATPKKCSGEGNVRCKMWGYPLTVKINNSIVSQNPLTGSTRNAIGRQHDRLVPACSTQ